MEIQLDAFSRGKRLRVRRVAAGMTVWQLARLVGMQPARISELENDRRDGRADEWALIEAALPTLDGRDVR